MRLITNLLLWSPVLTFLYFKGIRGQNNQFDVTLEFKQRHIRQGDCNGIYNDSKPRQSFRENLEQTARVWSEFKDNRTHIHTFILSRQKTVAEIAECISRLVYVNGPGRPGSFQATMDVDVKMNDFKTTCRFPDIQLAVIKDINWYSENKVNFKSCRCGEADFTVSYLSIYHKIQKKIHHFVRQQQGKSKRCI
jgi:hypothetical protein